MHHRKHASVGKKKRRLLPGAASILSLPLVLVAALFAYLLGWGACARLPHDPIQTIAINTSSGHERRYIALCAGLAANPHGYPGHCFAVWSPTYPIDFSGAHAEGFVPVRCEDQVTSLFCRVPGTIVEHAADGNMRMFDALIVAVDEETYEKSRRLRRDWQTHDFKAGESDCVAYVDAVAGVIGLQRPARQYMYPLDYIRALKRANCRRCEIFVAGH